MQWQSEDLRICFVGDSFVAGVGDETALGWTGRLLARSARAGRPATGYNLGIRRDTSTDIRARLREEVERRRPTGTELRLVFSFGVNDATDEGVGPRVPATTSRDNLIHCLDVAGDAPVLFVGPPPVHDEEHNRRILLLNNDFREICDACGCTFVDVFTALEKHDIWRRQVRDGDGAHPRSDGYTALFELVAPAWDEWLRS
ncbi:GDSL-type esterase/lipase family protein [Rhodococcus daqingensis]|uniref:GDSL-type esterase/lipase family protein n=1 Tax=Rhodococcus daqingensis TaxID=2479363 RepID=A0ABW2RVV1_9NOCA